MNLIQVRELRDNMKESLLKWKNLKNATWGISVMVFRGR